MTQVKANQATEKAGSQNKNQNPYWQTVIYNTLGNCNT